ncbi:caspase family protein [Streptomyces spinoverrucosus]|uniref:caspase family protein n=1 Tax=Streptomyces spinoverrucosus TaxID=284043 RepID=UPI0018C42DEB|nr:caspase family protein [Streptomyces spinoverrucosus]MBG0852850.1 caspase family protein [Streptomyces spinoverrucosus]
MGSIHTFMAGVNDYPSEIAPPLKGCVNDVTEAHRLVSARTAGGAQVRTVLDGAATVAAVEDGIRTFLGAAGPGDTALFWFSGHGTQQVATGADLLIEATGFNQALLCADGPLPDKRLGALLDAVAARGAHVVAVLDCCYSGGASRDDLPEGLTARLAPPRPEWVVPGGREVAPPAGPARHVLLAASRLDELSYEGYYGGRRHGAFTYALLSAVRAAGPDATYRQLLSAADARVQRSGGRQRPVLYPQTPGGAADLPFLGGAVAEAAGEHLLRCAAHGWEVDCGTGHGLRDGEGAEGTEFGVVGSQGAVPGAVVRARSVRADRTLVEPVGWAPDPERVYPVSLTALATPPATVSVDDGHASGLLRAALSSPLLRVVDRPEEYGDLHFRVEVRGDSARVLGRDGTDFVEPLPFTADGDARRVGDCLAHLARWHQLRDLTSRPSVLDNLVQVEVVPWDAADGRPLVPDGSGDLVCSYAPQGTPGPREPWVSIRLHNRSPHRTLWCVLLDLTDRYAADPALYPGHFIGPGRTGHALDGDPVQLSLPEGRAAVPGAECRDWLKLIVAEGELSTAPFRLRAWDPDGDGSREATVDPAGVVRFDAPGGTREAGPVTGGAPGRWATRTIALRTVVPPTGRGA